MNEHTIVALLATRGLGDFLLNTLAGLARAGVDPNIVHVARPDNATDEIDPILKHAGAQVFSIAEFDAAAADIGPDHHSDYGIEAFNSLNWSKIRYLRWLLESYRHVVYSDVDVAWLADPLWYLQAVGRHFPLAFATEACPRFPPLLCWGFLSAMASDPTRRFLDTLLEAHDTLPRDRPTIDGQAACNALIARDPSWLGHINLLPEGLFLNGLSYRSLLDGPPAATTLHGALAPFTFHANWTTGLESKRALMRQTGTWLLDGDTAPAEAVSPAAAKS